MIEKIQVLHGRPGESNYLRAIRLGLFVGTEQEYLESLKGEPGALDLTNATGTLPIAQIEGLQEILDQLLPPPVFSFDGIDDYHDTAIAPNSSTVFEVVGNFRTTATGTKVMGAQSGSQRYYFGVVDGRDWALGYNTFVPGGPADTDVHTFRVDSQGLWIDGTLAVAATSSISQFAQPIYLGAYNNGSASLHTEFDFQRATITHEGVVTEITPNQISAV